LSPPSDIARYVVGIDLGTTNCAVACADTEGDGTIVPFPIRQVTGAGEVEARPVLPSFLLLPTDSEVPPEAMTLPWAEAPGFTIGLLARERGADLPHRVVSSAKSWLCHTGVDRHAPILPWRGVDTDPTPEEAARLVSPVEASSLYLEHIRAAWNDAHPEAPLEEQEVYVTVPASFDAVARELTVAAGHQAGLPGMTLLEEPQAAFYAWLAANGDDWRQALRPGDAVLVCDVGGGTADFSIIAVVDDGAGNLALERMAVGDHILLGGDNMDLAVAHAVTQQLGDKLDPLQWRGLVHACRGAKERLLAPDAPEVVPVSVLGRGSKLIGRTLRTDLSRDHVERLILDGFFPVVDAGARPQRRRAMGLKELGLPYAQDPGITRHLAEFLSRHAGRPTAILFNGGVMKGQTLRRRVTDVVGGWAGRGTLPALVGNDLDLAVAHGAAYYGLVRRGRGIRIRGGTARAYYIGIESSAPAIPGATPPVHALCVAPFGMEEGTTVALPEEELGLVVGEKAEFRFFATSSRPGDRPGALVPADADGMLELDPVETTLPPGAGDAAGAIVPVTLSSHVTAVGTLELFCEGRGGRGRWRLEYGIRGSERE
jgi:molecular chaperone DnaK (HSP70)